MCSHEKAQKINRFGLVSLCLMYSHGCFIHIESIVFDVISRVTTADFRTNIEKLSSIL